MELALVLRWLHIIGATVLFGTGAGIAFFMVIAVRSRQAALIAHVASTVVIADMLFTATAVVAQPITGTWLAWELGWDLSEGWILVAIGLYLMTGVFCLPVVWIQARLRDIARDASEAGAELPSRFFQLYRIWFAFGFPAFFAVLTILWLMVARPDIAIW